MKGKEIRYTESLEVKLTPAEMETLKKTHAQSIYQSLSAYVRARLFNQSITIRQRNESFDDLIEEWIQLRKELQDFSKQVPLSQESEEKVLELIGQIKSAINKLVDLCMQK
jgi:predicted CopG family antitoxin